VGVERPRNGGIYICIKALGLKAWGGVFGVRGNLLEMGVGLFRDFK